MEKIIAAHLMQRAGLSQAPELEKILIDLVQSAKEGHLCQQILDASLLPSVLWEEGAEDPLPKKPLVMQGNRLYLQRNWALETLILQKVTQLLARPPVEASDRFKEELTRLTGLQEAQRLAIAAAFEKAFTLFTGGPGTGKTFTAGCFIRVLAASRDKPL